MAYNTGATFYPGGDDSYYMPEVVSPQPQRAAEAPVNMQENVAHMEQQASWRGAPVPQINTSQSYQQYGNNNPQQTNVPWSPSPPKNLQGGNEWGINNGNNNGNSNAHAQTYRQAQYQAPKQPDDQPSFSPFPPLRNRGPNIPPSDDEREASLEAAREAVLCSNDFDMQLTWAQDALAYVEVAIQNEANVAVTQGPRSRTPRVEHMLREDSLRVVEFLADQHHPKAEFMKGTWLEFGKFGHRIDKREAYSCYLRASERGYARAYYRIGMQFENSNEALKAIKYYQLGVDAGDSASCYRLGMMTLLGQHGQMRDYNRGLHLIRTAAQKADDNAPQGAYVLGMLEAGELVQVSIPESILPRNLSYAKSNIEKAAFLGFAKAQLRMGQAYELGDLGCPFDPVLSLHYNALAARQGEAEAEMGISKWFLCGQEGLFEKNEEMAFTYAQRAAVSGLATAQFAMGYFYEVGIYVATDLKQAREWYQKADENGNSDARKRIDAVSRSKTISRRDHENISLQRIRQQHAAAEKAPTLPSLPEFQSAQPTTEKPQSPTIDMPDPAKLSLNSTPAPQRPTSTAPYPTGGPSLNAPSPNIRPTSAFGINPRLQQQSQYTGSPGPRPDTYRVNSAPNNAFSPVDAVPSGQGYRPDNRRPSGPLGGHAAQQRLQQGPPPQQQQPQQQRPSTTSPPLGPQSYGSHRVPQSIPNQASPRPPQGPQSPPPGHGADIGFSAPPDPRPERRDPSKRLLPSQQRPTPPSQNQGSPRPYQGFQSEPSTAQRPSQPPSRPYNQPPNQGQPPSQGRPPQPSHIQPANLAPSQPIAAPPTPRPEEQKPQKVRAATAASQPPGKGPKTFEEMGVPQAQKESDCVVM